MAKKVKDQYLRGRVDADQYNKVAAYVELAEISQGDLVRNAVQEYMLNHPVKKPREEVNIKPGAQE